MDGTKLYKAIKQLLTTVLLIFIFYHVIMADVLAIYLTNNLHIQCSIYCVLFAITVVFLCLQAIKLIIVYLKI